MLIAIPGKGIIKIMSSKKEIIRLLKEKKYGELISLSPRKRKTITLLISLSYDKKNVISWRAIEAIGLITREVGKTNPDFVKNTIGRLIWMIRDESGGIGWSAPEILGEIVRNNPGLCADIVPIIVLFHEEKMLSAGVMWAIGRIGRINAEMVNYVAPIIISYIAAPDSILRGYAAWASGQLGVSQAVNELKKLKNDTDTISFYEEGKLKEKSVKEIAEKAMTRLKKESL
jgi:HEAT repeat protein